MRDVDDDPVSPHSQPPPSLPYNARFEDSLMETVLASNSTRGGMTVLPSTSTAKAVPGKSIVITEIDSSTLPFIRPSELPLPLNDERRTYQSPIPGVRFTHPGGAIEGGPGPFGPLGMDENRAKEAQDFIEEHGIRTQAQFSKVLEQKRAQCMKKVKEAMEQRMEAKQQNQDLDGEIKTLEIEREMERKVQLKYMKK
ncbi:hypothetical protein K402DRAFT_334776 [Aulographum hederae CBS 113979]|uniref:Uncharacterized protein n=1 Tax=Aulographum hederae CBS 113979 TaxID=1176131 RepID=A0A6G1GWH1_9PEZI|nr:hypothetical protein K402DRAFT_334776 [Aulographum hederae CBS 113979]